MPILLLEIEILRNERTVIAARPFHRVCEVIVLIMTRAGPQRAGLKVFRLLAIVLVHAHAGKELVLLGVHLWL